MEISSFLIWWLDGEVTPDLIPNSAVKLTSTDGSRKARVGSRQIKKLETFVRDTAVKRCGGGLSR